MSHSRETTMVFSKEWFDYHLTGDGWMRGSEKLDFSGESKIATPSKRVLTVRVHEEVPSFGMRTRIWGEKTWLHDDSKLVDKLLKRYGKLPPHTDLKKSSTNW